MPIEKYIEELQQKRAEQLLGLKQVLKNLFQEYYEKYHALPPIFEEASPGSEEKSRVDTTKLDEFLIHRPDILTSIQHLDFVLSDVTKTAQEIIDENFSQ